jgi:hypothetical protein
MPRRLTLSLKREPGMSARRVSIRAERLVYILVADRRVKYAEGRSRIVYIGTTRNGAARIAASVAKRAHEIFEIRGVRAFDARIVTSRSRSNVKSWLLLERALLLEFRARYGQVPWCNSHGKRMKERDEFTRWFRRARVRTILDEMG